LFIGLRLTFQIYGATLRLFLDGQNRAGVRDYPRTRVTKLSR
jgi:hypothetical protein